MKLKIRDSHAVINGDKTEHEMPSGCMDIIGDDGKTLFSISVDDGEIEISVTNLIKRGKTVLGERIAVRPRAANVIRVFRMPYE